MSVRTRTKTSLGFSSRTDVNSTGLVGDDRIDVVNLVNSATCKDVSHGASWRDLPDGGDACDISSIEYKASPCNINYDEKPYSLRHQRGPAVPIAFLYNENWGPLPGVMSDLDSLSLGATAIARTLPNSPQFSLANAIGELRQDGIPSVPGVTAWRSRTKLAKSAGEEYLNVDFGWKPLVRDIRGFAHAVKTSHATLERFRNGSDTDIHRRYSFPTEDFTGNMYTGVNGVGPIRFVPQTTNPPGFASRSVHKTTTFSGTYRYHIPMGPGLPDKLRRYASYADKLLGVDLSPSTLWELEPWSWAVDWFTNMGDVMKNISLLGKDGLVLRYGYITCRVIDTVTYTVPEFTIGSDPRKYSASLTIVRKNLKRRKATPYGFGFNLATLSARQDATLAALGLAKGIR